jgi:hypothetical protein
MLPEVAVIEVVSDALTLCPVAMPLLLMVAALVFDDVHVTPSVMTTLVPSSNVAVATNAWVSPDVIDAFVGVTSIDLRLAYVTDAVVVPLMEPDVAVIVVVPAAIAVTSPASLTVATPVSEDDQVTELVSVLVLPSL